MDNLVLRGRGYWCERGLPL